LNTNGNTADCSTLREFLVKIETAYGKARRVPARQIWRA
jgi:hypothetical protein